MTELANASFSLFSERLVSGDGNRAEPDTRRCLSRSAKARKSAIGAAAALKTRLRRLKIGQTDIYVHEIKVLLNSGAIPTFIPEKLWDKLILKADNTSLAGPWLIDSRLARL